MAVMKLGTRGERLDLDIRQGADLGPFDAFMANPDATPVNLTNCAIRAMLRKEPNAPLIAAVFDCQIVDPLAGHYRFGLTNVKTAPLRCGPTAEDRASQYYWDLELVDALGRVIPIYYGNAPVFREITHE